MNSYIPIFKDLSQGQSIYALIKSRDFRYVEGKIVSISLPRLDQTKNIIPQSVIDVTYELDNINYTDTINITDSMFQTEKPGSVTLVSTCKDSIIRELRATIKSTEEYLSTIDDVIEQKQKNLKQSKDLISKLDTEWAEKQAFENRIVALEENSKETNTLLKDLIKKLG